jgi:hypothetical protein
VALVLAFHVEKGPDGTIGALSRDALADAFEIAADEEISGSAIWEIGRIETGATCAIVDENGQFFVHVPLMRSPTLARDLLPTVHHNARKAGAAIVVPDDNTPLSVDDLLALWDREHHKAVHQLVQLCAAQGLPPPPHLPRADLDALHGWLLASYGTAGVPHPILALDPANGEPAIVVVRLPRPEEITRVKLPGVHAVLADLENARDIEEPAVFPVTALGGVVGEGGFLEVDTQAARDRLRDVEGIPLARYRVITPVEIVDDESFSPSLS